MKYDLITQNKDQIPVVNSCQILGVSKSAYYKYINAPELSGRALENDYLLFEIKTIFIDHKKRIGSPTVTHLLRNKLKKPINKKRVARIMRENGLVSIVSKKFKRTTDSNHPHPPSPNLLKNKPLPLEPNKVWVTDITYLWTSEGWLYLCMFLDLFTRKIVGWSTSSRMKADMVVEAYRKAIWHEDPDPGLIVHSDKGSQYASKKFRRALKPISIQSMSSTGNCYDNAFAESFFHTLKSHWYFNTKLETRAQAKTELFEYIESYYNRKHPHSSIGYLTPIEKEKQYKKLAA